MDDRSPSGPVLTAAQIAARWGIARSSITTMWRTGKMPAPFNAQMGRGHRWSLAAIEQFERDGAA